VADQWEDCITSINYSTIRALILNLMFKRCFKTSLCSSSSCASTISDRV